MVDKMVKIFTYGTLKRNEPNFFFLKKLGCKFVTDSVTVNKYPLLITTEFNLPFLLNLKGTGHHVKGEVFEVAEHLLPQLDAFEECPAIYHREVLMVSTVPCNGLVQRLSLASIEYLMQMI